MARTKIYQRVKPSQKYTNHFKNYKAEKIIKYGCDGRCTGEDDHGGVVDKERKGIHDKVVRSVLTNIVLFRYIVKLSRSNLEILYDIPKLSYNNKVVKKYKDIYSVDWMVGNGYHQLIKEKMERGESLKWTPSAIGGICGLVRDPEIFHYIYNNKRVLFTHHSLLEAAISNGNKMVFDILMKQTDPVSLKSLFELQDEEERDILRECISNGQYEMFLELVETHGTPNSQTVCTRENYKDPSYIKGLNSILNYLYCHVQEKPKSLKLDDYVSVTKLLEPLLYCQNIELIRNIAPQFNDYTFLSYIERMVEENSVTSTLVSFILEVINVYSKEDHTEILEILNGFSKENYPLLSDHFINIWWTYCIYRLKSEYPRDGIWSKTVIPLFKQEMDRIYKLQELGVNNNNQQSITDIFGIYHEFIMYLVEKEHITEIFKYGTLEMVQYIYKFKIDPSTSNILHITPRSIEIAKFLLQQRNNKFINQYCLTREFLINITKNGWVNEIDLLYKMKPKLFCDKLFTDDVYKWRPTFTTSYYEALLKVVNYVREQNRGTKFTIPASIFGQFTGDLEVIKTACPFINDLENSRYTPTQDDNLDALKYYCNELQNASGSNRISKCLTYLMEQLISKSFYNSINYMLNDPNVLKMMGKGLLDDLLHEAYVDGNTKLVQVLLKHGLKFNTTLLHVAKRGTIQEVDYVIENSNIPTNMMEGHNLVNIVDMLITATNARRMDVFKYLWTTYPDYIIGKISMYYFIVMGKNIGRRNDVNFLKYYINEFVMDYYTKHQNYNKKIEQPTKKRKSKDGNHMDDHDNDNEDDGFGITFDKFTFKKYRQTVILELLGDGEFSVECCEVLIGNEKKDFVNNYMIETLVTTSTLAMFIHMKEFIPLNNSDIPKMDDLPVSTKYYINQLKGLSKNVKTNKY